EQEQIRVAAQVALGHDFDEAQWAAAQRGLDVQRRIGLVGALAAEQRRRGRAVREAAHRPIAGPRERDTPARARLGHETRLERGDETGTEQRTLANSGRA